jgi:hypothetical protein
MWLIFEIQTTRVESSFISNPIHSLFLFLTSYITRYDFPHSHNVMQLSSQRNAWTTQQATDAFELSIQSNPFNTFIYQVNCITRDFLLPYNLSSKWRGWTQHVADFLDVQRTRVESTFQFNPIQFIRRVFITSWWCDIYNSRRMNDWLHLTHLSSIIKKENY